jgi:quercetin dioxygenase-like cupin family protein
MYQRCGMGLYVLEAGATDSQRPHTLDETYYIAKGKGLFKAGDKETTVRAGTVLFAKADVEHQLYDITEDLEIMVFFSTAAPGK